MRSLLIYSIICSLCVSKFWELINLDHFISLIVTYTIKWRQILQWIKNLRYRDKNFPQLPNPDIELKSDILISLLNCQASVCVSLTPLIWLKIINPLVLLMKNHHAYMWFRYQSCAVINCLNRLDLQWDGNLCQQILTLIWK